MSFWTSMLDIAASGKIPEERISPYIKFLEFPLVGSWHDKTVTLNWEATDKIHQDSGLVFGGYLAAFADYIAGSATLTVLKDNEIFFTKKFEIEYKKPLRTGNITITATVIKQEGIYVTIEVNFTNEKGDVHATAHVQQSIFTR